MRIFLKQCLAGAAMSFVFASAQAVPMLVNGGFETADFSGWTLTGSADYNGVDMVTSHSGDYAAYFGEIGMPASIAQTLATDAGHSYVVSFWLANTGGSLNNTSTVSSFEVRVGGNTLLASNDKTATDYTPLQVEFAATASATDLAFFFRHDEGFWLFDDVAIRELPAGPTGDVPEPASMLILTLGLGLIGLQRRRR